MPQKYDLNSMSDPRQLSQVASESFPRQDFAPHAEDEVSVREAAYKGHQIRVETTYRITVDGAPVTGHVTVGNDGQVHYHAIPNQQFESAVDMVKRVIDLTPPDSWPANPGDDHSHGDQHHH
jgi:hypothetical protein